MKNILKLKIKELESILKEEESEIEDPFSFKSAYFVEEKAQMRVQLEKIENKKTVRKTALSFKKISEKDLKKISIKLQEAVKQEAEFELRLKIQKFQKFIYIFNQIKILKKYLEIEENINKLY